MQQDNFAETRTFQDSARGKPAKAPQNRQSNKRPRASTNEKRGVKLEKSILILLGKSMCTCIGIEPACRNSSIHFSSEPGDISDW